MKKFLLAGASLLALTVVAQAADVSRPAAPKTSPAYMASGCVNSGLLSFSFGTGTTTGYYDYSASGLAASGSQNLCSVMGTSYNMQLDVAGDVFDLTNDYAAGFVGGSAHIYARNSAYALGIVVGASKLFESYEHYASGILGHFGVEGQIYSGNLTFAGQAVMHGAFGQDTDSANPGRATDVSAELRYFLNPNLKLRARVGYYTDNDPYADEDSSATYFTLGGEMLLDRSGISIFADYSVRNGEINGDTQNSSTLRLGVKSHWGQASLLSEDRTGASFYMPTVDSVQNAVNAYYR